MKFDVAKQLGAVLRTVSSLEVEGKPARAVTLGRTYETSCDDLWDALTRPERLARWFAPVTGDFKLNGRYQVQGNAGGEILACEPPDHLRLSWVMGEDESWVELWLSSDGDNRSILKLTHTAYVTEHWEKYGPSATGIGWELGLFGLELHLEDPDKPKIDEAAFGASSDGKAMIRGSGERWAQAQTEGGEDQDVAIAAARRTVAFYTGASESEL